MSAVLGAEHVGDDTLLDLAHGHLDPEQRGPVLRHVQSCSACEVRFREVVRDRERARIEATPLPPARVNKTALAWVAGAAAVLACVAVLALGRRGPAVPADWLPTSSTEVFLRDATPCADQGSALRAVEAYRARDAAGVVAALHGQDLPAACDPVKLLLASALVHQGDAGAALAVLDRLRVASLPQPARDRALWMQAAALDRAGRRGDADDILRGLAAGPGEYRDRATGLLARR